MIRRIFMGVINYDHPQAGMLGAFRGIFGHENVLDFDYLEMERQGLSSEQINRMFVERAARFRPDWAWLQLQNTGIITPESILALKERLPGCLISHWMGDARDKISSYLASICRATHVSFIANIGHMGHYRDAGAPRVEYLQHGVDWDEDVAGIPEWEPPFRVPDIVFVGHNYKDTFPGTLEREETLRWLVGAGFEVGVVGRGWPDEFNTLGECHVKQQFHVWRRAKVALSVAHFNDIEGHYSDRLLIAMASGTSVMSKRVPGLEKEFTPDVHCLMFQSREELLAGAGRLLASEALRRKIGMAGRAEILRRHTWFTRILDALAVVEHERAGLAARSKEKTGNEHHA